MEMAAKDAQQLSAATAKVLKIASAEDSSTTKPCYPCGQQGSTWQQSAGVKNWIAMHAGKKVILKKPVGVKKRELGAYRKILTNKRKLHIIKRCM